MSISSDSRIENRRGISKTKKDVHKNYFSTLDFRVEYLIVACRVFDKVFTLLSDFTW